MRSLVLEAFADAHGLRPGDRVPAVINGQAAQPARGRHRRCRRSSSTRSGRARWSTIRSATPSSGWTARRSRPRSSSRARSTTSRCACSPAPRRPARARRGGPDPRALRGPRRHRRARTRSRTESSPSELGQLEALAGMVPLVFLGVAAFLDQHRARPADRASAAGDRDAQGGRLHATARWRGTTSALVAVVMVPGRAVGARRRLGLGRSVLGLYAGIFRFPDSRFRMSLGARHRDRGADQRRRRRVAGALARRPCRGPSCRPRRRCGRRRPPATGGALVERLGLGALVGSSGMMVLREIERRPLRTLAVVAGHRAARSR